MTDNEKKQAVKDEAVGLVDWGVTFKKSWQNRTAQQFDLSRELVLESLLELWHEMYGYAMDDLRKCQKRLGM